MFLGILLKLGKKNLRIDFVEKYDLAIIADEVYQENLYGGRFISMASAIGKRDIPLFSLHSISKGFTAECGHRGGYMEIRNMPNYGDTKINLSELLIKLSIGLELSLFLILFILSVLFIIFSKSF